MYHHQDFQYGTLWWNTVVLVQHFIKHSVNLDPFSLAINALILHAGSLVCAIYSDYSLEQKCNPCTTPKISDAITFKMLKTMLVGEHFWHGFRDHFVCAPSQSDMMLHCNIFSHLMGAYTKWYSIPNQTEVNSLCPGDAIIWHKTVPPLHQVMACCLPAPSHYLNQCWLGIQREHPKAILQESSI